MTAERTYAAISIGATSVMMLIARATTGGTLQRVDEFIGITSCAEGLSKTGQLADEAINRTVRTLRELYDIGRAEGVETFICAVTEAIGKAKNANAFIQNCRRRVPFDVRFLDGETEAELSFLGATADQACFEPMVLINLGGTSTEIIFGIGTEKHRACSLALGYMDITQDYHLDRYFSFFGRRRARSFIQQEAGRLWQDAPQWVQTHRPLILLSGAINCSLAGMLRGELIMEYGQLHGVEGTLDDIRALRKKLRHVRPWALQDVPGIERDRARMVPGALLILDAVMRRFSTTRFRMTAEGLRTGLLKQYVCQQEAQDDAK